MQVSTPSRNATATGQGGLVGKRILAVEDDLLILLEIENVLVAAGAEVVGLCRSVEEALPVARSAPLDAALLDIRLRNETVAEVASVLGARGVPFAFYTGQTKGDAFLVKWPGHSVVEKPAAPHAIVSALAALIEGTA
jgi:DNA-binding NarL/FixJ family response regulator